MRFGLWCLLLTAAVSSLGGGCLRFGYGPRRDVGAPSTDAGVLLDAGAAYAGGSGGQPAASGAGAGGATAGRAVSGQGGARAAGSGGRAGASAGTGAGAGAADAGMDADAAMDAGVIGMPNDAGGDAATSDAAAADSGTYPGCPSMPGVLFCDDFEVADPDYEHWAYQTVQTGTITNGTITRTQALRHSGAWSLLAATTMVSGSSAQARQASLVLDHQKSGHAWLRSYNFVPSSVQISPNFALMVMSDDTFPWDGFELRLEATDILLNTTGAGQVRGSLPRAFPRNTWVCVELHVFVDPFAGYYEAYFDGEIVLQSGLVNTVPANGYSAAEVGIHYAPAGQPDAQVFVDDVAIGRSRIPCE